MDKIEKYFPGLTAEQRSQMEMLLPLYQEWNEKINVVSRKDIDHLYEHHVLHSLAIAKLFTFKPGTAILDLGSGGGFPGIPLAIMFPEVKFVLVDSIGKKMKVAQAVADALGLKNVSSVHGRAESMKPEFDFVVTRGVAELGQLLTWSRPVIRKKQINAWPNGLLALKGGNALQGELQSLGKKEYFERFPIQKIFKEEFFEEKSLVYVQA